MQTKRFADNPFNSVSFHSPFQFAVNTDSNSIKSQFVGTKYQREPFTMPTRSLPVYLVKLPALTKKGCFREFTLRQCILSRETLTSFCTTGIQNCTTGTGRHPRTESMGTFAFNIAGLKGTFTHFHYSLSAYVAGLSLLKPGIMKCTEIRCIPGYFCPAQPVH